MLTLIILSAENNALRKATAAQPAGLSTIPWPEKGVTGNGFNLCAAMELGDDHMLYCTVHVSIIFYYLFLCLIIPYLALHSEPGAQSRTRSHCTLA